MPKNQRAREAARQGAKYTQALRGGAEQSAGADLGLLQGTPLGATTLAGLAGTDLADADGQIAAVHITAAKPQATA